MIITESGEIDIMYVSHQDDDHIYINFLGGTQTPPVEKGGVGKPTPPWWVKRASSLSMERGDCVPP